MTMKNKDTFTLWGVQDEEKGQLVEAHTSREQARYVKEAFHCRTLIRVVKLECRIVDQKKPRKTKTFTAHGLEWIPHTPGDPMPCDGNKRVRVLMRAENECCDYTQGAWPAKNLKWEKLYSREEAEIVGWNYANAK
jgi:hypothetical protein